MKVLALAAVGGVAATMASRNQKDLLLESLILEGASVSTITANPSRYLSKAEAYQAVQGAGLESAFEKHEMSFLQTSANVTDNAEDFYGSEAPQVVAAEKVGADTTKLDDNSIKKGVKILNAMIESAQAEVDAVTIKCKAFHTANRALFKAIVSDLGRMGAELANLDRVKAGSNACIKDSMEAMKTIETKMDQAQLEYDRIFALDDAELTVRKNDLAMGEFIMKVTECERSKKGTKTTTKKMLMQDVKDMEMDESGMVRFLDPEVQDKLEAMMNKNSQSLAQKVMMASFSGKLVRGSELDGSEAYSGPTTDAEAETDAEESEAENTDDSAMSFVQLTESTECLSFVQEAQSPKNVKPRGRQSRKCSRAKVNMCLINDNMSLMWGEMKDAVDELTDIMKRKENDHEEFMKDMNDQLKTATDTKDKCTDNLNEATGRRNQVTEEQAGKTDEKDEVEKEFKKVWGECNQQLDELVYTKMCGARIVRSDVAEKGTKFKGTDIGDCEVGDFVPGKCSQPCDAKKKGKAKAGRTILTREIISKNNTYGTACPQLSYPTTCNAFLCPIDCKHSSWSAYGKCTKECEGGTKMRTRRITRQPLNGGKWCEDVVDSTSCNTMSCDRNCRLHGWTKYTMCSQACDGGFKERFRKVRVPTRGRGYCWRKASRTRYGKRGCNKQKCMGDEVCIGKVDMIIAMDGSGSLRKVGWGMIQNFTSELVAKFKAKKYKRKAMKVGLIQFGNGAIETDKKTKVTSVRNAIMVNPLTFKLKGLAEKIKKLKWQGGFTNMAQAFTLSENLFREGGRKRAQSQVVVISDGKPSFKYQTEKAANDLKDANVHVNMVIIHPMIKSKEVKFMQQLASKPYETHSVWIEGIKGLTQNVQINVMKTLVNFCPRAQSPKLMKLMQKKRGFKLVIERRDCLDWWWRLHRYCPTPNRCRGRRECSAAARKVGAKYFVIYTSRWWGRMSWCYAHKKNDGKCLWKGSWWWRGRKGWIRSIFNVYALEGETGANEAKNSLFTQVEEKSMLEHGKRPYDDKAGARDEEVETPGHLDNRDLDEFADDEEVPDAQMDESDDDDEI
jgi:hypothetical protein